MITIAGQSLHVSILIQFLISGRLYVCRIEQVMRIFLLRRWRSLMSNFPMSFFLISQAIKSSPSVFRLKAATKLLLVTSLLVRQLEDALECLEVCSW